MFEDDFIVRIIKSIGQVLISQFKGKSSAFNFKNDINNELTISQNELLKIMVDKYVSTGKLDEAENMIFESINSCRSDQNLSTELYFYDEINKFSENELTKYNFSKLEIEEGLKDLKTLYKHYSQLKS